MAETQTTEEKKKLQPKISSEEVGPCKVKLTIEVSAAKVQELIDGKYQELSDNVALPGFRKGHAPRKLLERKFGKSVLDDMKVTLLTDSFDEAKEEAKLEPVGEPELDVDSLSVKLGESFRYEVTIEVMPKIEVKDYTGIELTRPAVEITDADIDAAIESVREQRAEWAPLKEGETATLGDQIIGDFRLLADGTAIDQSENVQIELTKSVMLYQQKIDGFDERLTGKRPGETVTFDVTLPADHPTLAGKAAVLEASLKSIKRKVLPPIDEKLFKALDVDDAAEMRELLGKQVRRSKESEVKEQLKDQLMEKLIEANAFTVPAALQKEAESRMTERLKANYLMHGVPEDRIAQEIEQQGAKVRELGVKALRGQLLLEAVAAKERIFVTEGMMEEKIGQMAQAYESRPDEMRAYLEAQGMLPSLRREYRAELTRDFLLQKAKIADAPA